MSTTTKEVTRLDPWTVKDSREGTLCGPMPLDEALARANPGNGVRLAVSCPEGRYVAVQIDAEPPLVRRACDPTGHGGSRLETGYWLDSHGEQVARLQSWRPV